MTTHPGHAHCPARRPVAVGVRRDRHMSGRSMGMRVGVRFRISLRRNQSLRFRRISVRVVIAVAGAKRIRASNLSRADGLTLHGSRTGLHALAFQGDDNEHVRQHHEQDFPSWGRRGGGGAGCVKSAFGKPHTPGVSKQQSGCVTECDCSGDVPKTRATGNVDAAVNRRFGSLGAGQDH